MLGVPITLMIWTDNNYTILGFNYGFVVNHFNIIHSDSDTKSIYQMRKT